MRALCLACLSLLLTTGCVPECEPLDGGAWRVETEYPYGDEVRVVALEVTLRMQAEEGRVCPFSLSDWRAPDGELPDSLPSAGIVNIDEAFFEGEDIYWYSCEGEVLEADLVEGTCFSGAPLLMERL